MIKNPYITIVLYILGLISLILLEFFEVYFSKNILNLFKLFCSITFLLIVIEYIKTYFIKKK